MSLTTLWALLGTGCPVSPGTSMCFRLRRDLTSEIAAGGADKFSGWLPTLRLHDAGSLILSIEVSEMVVVVVVETRNVCKRTPLIGSGHIQENASSEVGDRILWTQSACGWGCGISEEEEVVSGHCLSRSSGKGHWSILLPVMMETLCTLIPNGSHMWLLNIQYNWGTQFLIWFDFN